MDSTISRKALLAEACAVINRDLESLHSIKPDYLPDQLKSALRAFNGDSSGEDLGTLELWTAIAGMICRFLELNEHTGPTDKDIRLLRYTNGVVLLARNLIITESAIHAFDLDVPSLIAQAFHVTMRTSEHREKLPPLFSSILQFFVNLSMSVSEADMTGVECVRLGLRQLFELSANELGTIAEKDAVYSVEFASLFLAYTGKPFIADFKVLLQSTAFIELLARFLDKLLPQITEGEDGVIATNQTGETIQSRATEFAYQSALFGAAIDVLEALRHEYIAAAVYMMLLRHALDHLINAFSNDLNKVAQILYTQLEFYAGRAVECFQKTSSDPSYARSNSTMIYGLWRATIAILELVYDFLDVGGAEAEDYFLSCTSKTLGTSIDESYPSITTLLDMLNSAEKYLPKRNKLSEEPLSQGIEYSEFPFLKKTLVPIISALAKNRRSVQDQVRVQGGLVTILNNCMIDRNNPYIRELSIICIRCLLEGNPENQLLVSQLEAKEPVQEQALIDAGLETEIVDGKVRIKKK